MRKFNAKMEKMVATKFSFVLLSLNAAQKYVCCSCLI